MENLEFISNSVNDTQEFAKLIKSKLSVGDCLVLNGDLGAGKTTFTKCLAKEFNVKEEVLSPTFTFINEYTSGDVPLYHFDMYRIDEEEEALEIGVLDYFNFNGKPKGICIVEWAENIKGLIPKHITLEIQKLGDTSRKFILRG